ncbi:MAG: ABC transporter substrate-binding protein, partial [Candidatus Gracilibacteria bacterium]|nr:ABC transporter substrate-binding protein [Candidatus Gracilibacteria bacterium]
MDKVYIAKRLKKYLFLISIIFIVLTTSHLIYSYFYSDAKETAIKGGSISEALIGQTPSLNPLKNNSSNDKYINSIVYRSLLKYDKNKITEPDLAKCDTRNLLKIECFLETNIKWSNGDEITKDDIIATFKTLKESKVNPIMNSLLKNTTIEKTEISIIFTNTKKDINILKIFFQPIVSQKILNIISKKEIEGNFSISSGIFSGKYKIINILKDETSQITTITLNKNSEYFKNNTYIETIIFKVFPTVGHFLKNKNSINIFNDKNNLITGTVPKLGAHNYTLPQYVSLFVNTQKIVDNDFRNLILKEIDRKEVIDKISDKQYKEIKTHYLNDIFIKEERNNKLFKNILNKKGYFNIKDLEKKLKLDLENEKKADSNSGKTIINQIKNLSEEVKIKNPNPLSGTKVEEEKSKLNSAEEKITNSKSKIIFSPSWVDIYNFVSKNSYLLKGKTKKLTTEVYINDYKLKSFKANSSEFAYKISEKSGTFKNGENNYKIYFVINGKKELQEEVNFYRNSNKEILKKAEKDFFEKVIIKNPNFLTESKEKINSNPLSGAKDNIITKIKSNINYIKSDKYKKIEEKIEKVKSLDKTYFYNEKLEKYNLELYYVSNKKDIRETS